MNLQQKISLGKEGNKDRFTAYGSILTKFPVASCKYWRMEWRREE